MAHKIATKISTFRLALVVLALLLMPTGAWAAPQANPVIYKVYITNVRDSNFVVSWTTDILSDGKVTWGYSTPPTTIVSDGVTSTTTHYVTISGLTVGALVYFQVSSGNTVDNNGGAYYQVTTGPALTPPTGDSKNVWGYMYLTDGTTIVPNAIVYLQLQDANGSGSSGSSQLVSTRAESSGVWSFDLRNVRTSDFQTYYVFTDGADNLRIIGQGGVSGTRGVDPDPWVVIIPPTYPAQFNVILQQNPTAVTLKYFMPIINNQVNLPVLALGLISMAATIWLVGKRR